jgi:hypothetical protein
MEKDMNIKNDIGREKDMNLEKDIVIPRKEEIPSHLRSTVKRASTKGLNCKL